MRENSTTAQVNAQAVLKKYDPDSATRRLSGPVAMVAFTLALAWSLFQVYTAVFGTFPSTLQRAPHVGAAATLIYLLYPARKGKGGGGVPWYDYLLALLSVMVSMYHVVYFDELQLRSGMYTQLDFAVSVTAVLLILEGTRRVAGPVMVVLAVFFLLYAYMGSYFPGFLAHRGLSIKRIVTFQWLGTEGILGTPVYVSSTFIFLFLLFACFLKKSGVGDWLTGLAMGLCGGATGGPAKAAVVASAFQGTITGSSVSNVVSTGPITIPLMRKCGYSAEFAAAVEASASTGGQIMPPIMGAAAFIMTEYIGTSYANVVLAACIPSLLYFTGVFTNVHFEALKKGLRGLPKAELPEWRPLLRKGWYMSSPLAVIIIILAMGFTPMRAALFGLLTCIAVWIFEFIRTGKFKFNDFFLRTIYALEEGARSAVTVATTCACAGIIVGIITLTGLGLKMAGGIVALAGGLLLPTMLLTLFCCLLLGMGVPTTANYIIQATISAPAMIALGVEPLAAHLFVFYYGIVADITPPVALAAFAGSSIARSDPMMTGVVAFRLGIAAYIVPFIFVLDPVLLIVRPDDVSTFLFILMVIKAILAAIIGMICIATSFTGYLLRDCKLWERALLAVAGILLINPHLLSNVVGLGILVLTAYHQKITKARGFAPAKEEQQHKA